jgi:hypothetical protein
MFWIALALAAPPSGWQVAGDGYRATTSAEAHHGSHSAELTALKGSKDFGTLMQSIHPRDYLGKRLRMTIWLKTEDVEGWAGAWLRVDADGEEVAFDNMQDRALHGTQAWSMQSLVVDVPQTAEAIVFGGLLSGKGTLWLDDLRLEVVDASVPVTDQLVKSKAQPPRNLSFDE